MRDAAGWLAAQPAGGARPAGRQQHRYVTNDEQSNGSACSREFQSSLYGLRRPSCRRSRRGARCPASCLQSSISKKKGTPPPHACCLLSLAVPLRRQQEEGPRGHDECALQCLEHRPPQPPRAAAKESRGEGEGPRSATTREEARARRGRYVRKAVRGFPSEACGPTAAVRFCRLLECSIQCRWELARAPKRPQRHGAPSRRPRRSGGGCRPATAAPALLPAGPRSGASARWWWEKERQKRLGAGRA